MTQLSLSSLTEILQASAALHHHLCPRQVIGVRMGLYAGDILGLALPQTAKRLLTIVETDGCASDGVATATNCWVGRRTLRIEDYGKVAATFVNTETGEAIRLAPHPELRQRAHRLLAGARNKWEAELLGYQRLAAAEMFTVQAVMLRTPLADLISRPGRKAVCSACGEEIMNEREVSCAGTTLCRACAGESYYAAVTETAALCQPLSWAAPLN